MVKLNDNSVFAWNVIMRQKHWNPESISDLMRDYTKENNIIKSFGGKWNQIVSHFIRFVRCFVITHVLHSAPPVTTNWFEYGQSAKSIWLYGLTCSRSNPIGQASLMNVIKMIFYYENFLDSIPSTYTVRIGAVVKYIEAESISELFIFKFIRQVDGNLSKCNVNSIGLFDYKRCHRKFPGFFHFSYLLLLKKKKVSKIEIEARNREVTRNKSPEAQPPQSEPKDSMT